MKRKTDPRLLHTGKTPQEKEAYQKFLRGDLDLDKTAGEKLDISHTNTSSFQEEESIPETDRAKKKGFLLKFKDGDFLNNPWFVTVVGGIIVSIFIFFTIQTSFSQGNLTAKVESLQKGVDSSRTENAANKDSLNKINLNLSLSMEGMKKDIEYIKSIFHIQ
ncbi:MAG: hypothetical protein WD992_00270 [Candidatus Levyibacteriota bacterium]